MAIEKLYTVPEAADTVRCSPWTIWAKLTKGEIKRTKIGNGRTVIRESELLKLIKDEDGE